MTTMVTGVWARHDRLGRTGADLWHGSRSWRSEHVQRWVACVLPEYCRSHPARLERCPDRPRRDRKPRGVGQFVVGETDYAENVYEWEQEGVGSCPEGQSAGCVYLISDGRDKSVARESVSVRRYESAVCLLGSDGSGANVFFPTADQLVPRTLTLRSTSTTLVSVNRNKIIRVSLNRRLVAAMRGRTVPWYSRRNPLLLAPGTASFNGEGNITAPAGSALKPKSLNRGKNSQEALRAVKREREVESVEC